MQPLAFSGNVNIIYNMKKLATLKNIAEYVGVNPATVSRALDPGKKKLISAEVCEKIEKVANKLNYRPRASGRSLATNKSLSIGIVLQRLEKDMGEPFFAVFLSSFIICLSKSGYSVQILPVSDDQTREKEILNYLYSGRVDGFFIGQAMADDKVLDEIESRKVPVVILDEIKQVKRNLPCIRVDEQSGATEAVDFLLKNGISKVAYRVHDYIHFSPLRMVTFENTWLEKTGKNIEKIIYKPKVRGTLSDRVESYKSAMKDIGTLKKYEAIVCCTDLSALGVIDALSDNGIVAGKDMMIIGYDNIEENPNYPQTQPILSTIDKQYRICGKTAAEMLLRQLETGGLYGSSISISTKFIRRSSTGE